MRFFIVRVFLGKYNCALIESALLSNGRSLCKTLNDTAIIDGKKSLALSNKFIGRKPHDLGY